MDWQNDNSEHARIWNSAVGKIVKALDKTDLQTATRVFSYDLHWFFNKIPFDEHMFNWFFLAWLIPCFMKENEPLIRWYIKHHGRNLTKEEAEVLFGARESIFGVFNVKSQIESELKLVDTSGKTFFVDTINLETIKTGTAVIARLNSKGNGKYFAPGPIIPFEDNTLFIKMKNHRKFRDSWSDYLVGFFKYLVSEENLSEKTADKHTENVNLLMFFLETELEVDSFSKVTKTMLKTDFKKYVKRYILGAPDIDKVYYSLFKFFDYLEEEREIKNEEALNWLQARI